MKEFSLEEYLKNPDREVVTRDGCNVKIKYTGMWTTDHPIVALVDFPFSAEERMIFTEDGKFISNDKPSRFDLFFA